MMKKNLFIPLIVLVLAVLVLLTPVYGAEKSPDAGKAIKIGIIGPMDMRTGNHMMITAQMAVEKINASGGIKIGNTRHPIELIKITSNEFKKVTDAVAAAERAITADKVDFLIGGIVAEAVSAIQDIAADNKTIYISTSYTVSQQYVERMTKNYDRYKYCFTAASMEPADIAKVHLGIVGVVSKAVRQSGLTKVKVAQMVEKTAGGDGIIAMTTNVFPKMGMEIAGIWRPSPSASDLRAETAAIKSSNPNIIYTVFSGAGGIVFGKQLAELKIPAIVAGSPAASLFPAQGIEYSVTMMSAASIPIKISDKNIAFYNEFLKRSGGELCVASAHDTIMNLAHNIELAGSLDANAIIKNMEAQEYPGGIGGPVKYDPKDHRTIMLKGYKPVYGVQQLPGGKVAIVWPTDAAVKASPVQIPQWMIDSWKNAK
jgi:branched-chain amino acid transport system substrate-binding protein